MFIKCLQVPTSYIFVSSGNGLYLSNNNWITDTHIVVQIRWNTEFRQNLIFQHDKRIVRRDEGYYIDGSIFSISVM